MYKEHIAPAPAVRVYDEKLRILTQVPAYNRKIQNSSFSNITTPEMQNKKQPKTCQQYASSHNHGSKKWVPPRVVFWI